MSTLLNENLSLFQFTNVWFWDFEIVGKCNPKGNTVSVWSLKQFSFCLYSRNINDRCIRGIRNTICTHLGEKFKCFDRAVHSFDSFYNFCLRKPLSLHAFIQLYNTGLSYLFLYSQLITCYQAESRRQGHPIAANSSNRGTRGWFVDGRRKWRATRGRGRLSVRRGTTGTSGSGERQTGAGYFSGCIFLLFEHKHSQLVSSFGVYTFKHWMCFEE